MTHRFLSAAIAFLAMAAAIFTVFVAAAAMNAKPVIMAAPNDAENTAKVLMDAICSGNDALASSVLHGTPKLSTALTEDNPAVELLWNAYRKSFSYRFNSDCYPTDEGVAMDVFLEALDLDAVLSRFAPRVQALLEERTASRGHAELYDSDGHLLPEQAEKLLSDAMLLTLGEENAVHSHTFTLHLRFSDGKWWVLPEEALFNLLSGQECAYV